MTSKLFRLMTLLCALFFLLPAASGEMLLLPEEESSETLLMELEECELEAITPPEEGLPEEENSPEEAACPAEENRLPQPAEESPAAPGESTEPEAVIPAWEETPAEILPQEVCLAETEEEALWIGVEFPMLTAALEAGETQEISTIALSGVTEPVAGVQSVITGVACETEGVSLVEEGAVQWLVNDDFYNGCFVAGNAYTIKIVLRLQEGYALQEGCTVTVNGQAGILKGPTDTGKGCEAYYTFPLLYAVVNEVEIKGVTLPVEDALPTVTGLCCDGADMEAENTQWLASTSGEWSPWTEAFLAGETYRLQIRLIPHEYEKFGEEVTCKISGAAEQTVAPAEDGSLTVVADYTAAARPELSSAVLSLSGNYREGAEPARLIPACDTEGAAMETFAWENENGEVVSDPLTCGTRHFLRVTLKTTGDEKFTENTAVTLGGKNPSQTEKLSNDRLVVLFDFGILTATLSQVELTGVETPVVGKTAVTDPIGTSTPHVSIHAARWLDGEAGTWPTSEFSGTFQNGREYALEVTLSAKDACAFAPGCVVSVGGLTGTVSLSEEATRATVRFDFGQVSELTGIRLSVEYIVIQQSSTLDFPTVLYLPAGCGPEPEWALLDEDHQPAKENSTAALGWNSMGQPYGQNSGTGYIQATVRVNGQTFVAECRVDVTAGAIKNEWTKFSLLAQKATVNLLSTEGTLMEIQPILKQNSGGASNSFASQAIDRVVISQNLQELLAVEIVNDRALRLVPQEGVAEAVLEGRLTYPKKTELSVALYLTGLGSPLLLKNPIPLTLTATLPKIRAAAVKLNSFAGGLTAALTVTGGKVTRYEAAEPLPDWLSLNETTGVVTYIGTPGAKVSAAVTLHLTVEGYALPQTVSVKVNAAPKAPKITLSAKQVTLNAGAKHSVALQARITPEELAALPLTVTVQKQISKGVYAPTEALRAELSGQSLVIGENESATDVAGVYRITVAAEENPSASATLTVTVTEAPPKLTLKATGCIDLSIPNSAVTITPTLKGSEFFGRCALRQIIQSKKGQPDRDVTADFTSSFDESTGALTLIAKGTLDPTCGYKAIVVWESGTALAEGTVKISLKQTAPAKLKPTVTAKLTGTLDPLRENSAIWLTATLLQMDPTTPQSLTFLRKNGKAWETLPEDADFFVATQSREGWRVTAGDELNAGTSYGVCLNCGGVASKVLPIKVKMGKVAIKSNTASGTLYTSDRFSEVVFTLTVSDESLRGIDHITLDNASGNAFALTSLSDGENRYAIGWKSHSVTLPAGKNQAVKIGVWMKGNLTDKPNVTLTVKIAIR